MWPRWPAGIRSSEQGYRHLSPSGYWELNRGPPKEMQYFLNLEATSSTSFSSFPELHSILYGYAVNPRMPWRELTLDPPEVGLILRLDQGEVLPRWASAEQQRAESAEETPVAVLTSHTLYGTSPTGVSSFWSSARPHTWGRNPGLPGEHTISWVASLTLLRFFKTSAQVGPEILYAPKLTFNSESFCLCFPGIGVIDIHATPSCFQHFLPERLLFPHSIRHLADNFKSNGCP